MQADFNGDLRRRIEEAALLPSDHPMRRDACDHVSEHGDGARQVWRDVQQENESLLVELHEVPAPSGLQERLLIIPQNVRRRSRAWKRSIFAAAAVLVLAMTVVPGLLMHPGAEAIDASVVHVASLVADDHSARSQLTVVTSDPRQLFQELQPKAPFPIDLTTTPAAATLVGARICSFGEGPLIYTRWSTTKGDLSMYQLRLSDFGVPPNLPPQEVRQDQPGDRGARRRCRVRLWSDDLFAYAIVVDDEPADSGS